MKTPKKGTVKIVKPTADSTKHYKNVFTGSVMATEDYLSKGNKKSASISQKIAKQADKDMNRQKYKGKPGYDKNGFPIKKKK